MQTKNCVSKDKVCLKYRQTFSRPERGRSKALRSGAIVQTNFVCKCRQKGARFAGKVCLKNADKPLQTNLSKTLPPQMQTNFIKNADARAGGFGKLQTNYADKLCLPIRRGRLHFGSGLSTEFFYSLRHNADQVCLNGTREFFAARKFIYSPSSS